MTEQKRVEVLGESLEEIFHHGYAAPRRGEQRPQTFRLKDPRCFVLRN